ncbi:MAG: DUF4287 domain-containing protein, partial [Alphaproteobacteria bacterium]|nr:DUF4287 domain-containing protein [Alphaproteobacteria bacterium]
MTDLHAAANQQLANLQARAGKTLEDLVALGRASGLTRHGQLRDHFKQTLGMGHGDANLLAHHVLNSSTDTTLDAPPSADDALAAIYAGPKAALRPIHDAVMALVDGFGPYEVAPKKAYVSLRRRKQFAMVGPATKTQVEIGLNHKDLPTGGRLV